MAPAARVRMALATAAQFHGVRTLSPRPAAWRRGAVLAQVSPAPSVGRKRHFSQKVSYAF